MGISELNSGLNGIRTHHLCDTGAELYQLSYQAIWELVTLWVRNIPTDVEECNWIWRYEDIRDHRSYIRSSSSCETSIAEVIGSKPVQALISQLLKFFMIIYVFIKVLECFISGHTQADILVMMEVGLLSLGRVSCSLFIWIYQYSYGLE